MDFADQLKSSVDIVRTVGEYVRLRKMGPRYVGLCPFHTEKTPSFGVTPAMSRFKCFGCGAGGDVITFVQQVEQLTFWEACTLLAERNGIPLPKRHEPNDAETDLRAALFEMHEIAAKLFRENLFSTGAGDARAYLNKRGITQSVAEQFGLGLSERPGQELLRKLRQQFSNEQIVASGLVGRREDGSVYDRFRGRLMFPIHNESGKIIAFGGRTLLADEQPKYLNSPETAIYKKSNVLYNLHRAKDAVRKGDRAVLVEGYMDVLGVFAAGVHNVVASCGTALTTPQVRSLKRHSEHIVVNFDPDAAGANATERSIQMLLEEKMQVRVLALEGGLDPDEYIKTNGSERYSTCLHRAPSYFIWLADRARKSRDMSTAEGRIAGYKDILLPAIRKITDRLEQATVAAEVADYLNIDRSLVLQDFRRSQANTPTAKKAATPLPHEERVVLRTLLVEGEARRLLLEALQDSEAARRFQIWPILQKLLEMSSIEGSFTLEQLHKILDAEAILLVESVVFGDKSGEIFSASEASAWLQTLRVDDARASLESLCSHLKEAERNGNVEEAYRLMVEINIRKRELRQ